jgi:hypothetical protein
MEPKDVFVKSLVRAQELLDTATADLTPVEIAWRAGPMANPIGFILWHLSRGEDRFVNTTLRPGPQVWETGDWPLSLGLPADPEVSGIGFSTAQVAAFPVPSLEALLGYQRAVRQATLDFIDSLNAADLDRSVTHPRLGEQTMAEFLARVVVEVSQHTGQIDFIRGLKRSLDQGA